MKLRNKKTGEVTDNIFVYDGFICVDVWKGDSGTYASLTELNDEWEDYAPQEPLIKDEKIRKAVRVWADGNNIESVHYDAFWRGFRRKNSSITVWEELPLEDNEVYTIAELCGEEK